MNPMRAIQKPFTAALTLGLCLLAAWTVAAKQPAVAPGPDEPDWPDLLERQWGLDMDRDLRNPLAEGVAPAALFRRVNLKKPVTFKPVIALGLETATRGGWYPAGPRASDLPDDDGPTTRREVWSYRYKQPKPQRKAGPFTPPPIESGKGTFDPGDQSFGLWVSNEKFDDGGVYTQPALVAQVNRRLKSQPYKAMIYPNIDAKSRRPIPDSYIIGWEYSTNDDFQDVVTQIDNVRLLPADPPLKGILAAGAEVKKLASGFKFVEGPAWDFKHHALYFSDIPPQRIMHYADGQATVACENTRSANGLMFDRQGYLIACEHAGRRVSRGVVGEPLAGVATHYKGKKLNSPNDLWIDAAGGIYFTDPRYGKRDNLEQDKEAVYYIASDGTVTRVADDPVRPNGIALSPDGRFLYVADNGADKLYRYPVTAPGKIGRGSRIAMVDHPDGMTVDATGRLYVTCRGGVWVLDANGKWLGMIATTERPANCTFGGPGYRTLFITARTSLYAIETATRGWHVHLDGPPPGTR